MESVDRKILLGKMLEDRNLKLRTDSKLCEGYINNGDDFEYGPKEIVDIMEEMEFYYGKTTYKMILKNDLRSNEKDKGRKVTDDEHNEIRERSKLKALKLYKFKNKNDKEMTETLPVKIRELIGSC
jgi:hypothetical protein